MHTIFGIPLIYFFIASALLLPRIPYIGKFFNVINTTIHELGHALMALFFEGKIRKIEIHNDSSGSTVTQCKSNVGNFFISIAGYPFASIVGYFSFYLLSVNYEKGFLWTLSILYLFMLIFWIRNGFGIFWTIVFSGFNLYLLWLDNSTYLEIAVLLYATFIAVESFTSPIILLILSIKDPTKAGDATILHKLTHIPAFIWSVLFTAFSFYISYLIVIKNLSLFNLP